MESNLTHWCNGVPVFIGAGTGDSDLSYWSEGVCNIILLETSQFIERDSILHGFDTHETERDAILHGFDTHEIERDIILKGQAVLTDFLYSNKVKFPTDVITIGGAVSNLPHCFRIDSAHWAAGERDHFFGEWNVDGKRCQFFDKDGNNLPYEVEYYSEANEEAIYWVKKSVLASDDGTNNYIYVGYGNDPNESNQDDPTNVWKSDFKLVTHLKDITTSTVNDSTSNANHGTKKGANEPIEAAGIVHKGQDFDGSNDFIAFPDQAYYTFGDYSNDSPFSCMASIEMDDATNFRTMVKAYHETSQSEWQFVVASDDKLYLICYSRGSTANSIRRSSDSTLTAYQNQKIRVAATYDGSKSGNGMKLYIDGSEIAGTAGSVGSYVAMQNTTAPLDLGVALRNSGSYRSWANGLIDEARLLAGEASADWIKLDYYSIAVDEYGVSLWYEWEGEAATVIERDAILHGLDTYDMERDAILHGYEEKDIERDIILKGTYDIERDSILHGLDTYDMERDAILRGYVDRDIERDFILDGQIASVRNFILRGFDNIDRGFILSGESHLDDAVWFILKGVDARDSERDFIIRGLDGLGRDFIIPAMPNIEAAFIIRGDEILPAAWKTKRLTLLDTFNLRTTAVYRNPRDISVLQIVCGDFMQSRVPCTPLDRDGYIHHVSDRPMQMIDKVYADNEPVAYGYRAHAAYQDETGQRISCVIFDNPQYDKRVSVTGKGAFRTDSPAAELIENPADLIRFLFLDVQGYDASSIDLAELSRFYADGLAAEMKVAALLNDFRTIKAFLDELADNIHSQWMISDGKSVMRYRWL